MPSRLCDRKHAILFRSIFFANVFLLRKVLDTFQISNINLEKKTQKRDPQFKPTIIYSKNYRSNNYVTTALPNKPNSKSELSQNSEPPS